MPIDVEKIGLGKHEGEREKFSVPEGRTRRIPTDPAPRSPEFYDVIVIRALMDHTGGEIYHLVDADLPEDRRMRIPEASFRRSRRLHEHILPGDPTTVKDYIYENGKRVYELNFSAPRYVPRNA